MRKVEHAVGVGVDRLAASGQIDESGFFAAVALIPPQAGNSATNGMGTGSGTTLEDFFV